MVEWRVAKSLDKLLDQINTLAPHRSKATDGSIGDEAHAASSSDHNPWIDDPTSSVNVVSARDFTHDPAKGADMFKISDMLRLSRDPRIKYVIFYDRVFSSTTQPWIWRPYSGSNNHRHHMHVSVVSNKSLYDDVRDWMIGMPDLTQAQIDALMNAVNQITWEVRPWVGDTVNKVAQLTVNVNDLKAKVVALEPKINQILTNQAEDTQMPEFTPENLEVLKEQARQLEIETRTTLIAAVNQINSEAMEQAARKAVESYDRKRAEDVLDND